MSISVDRLLRVLEDEFKKSGESWKRILWVDGIGEMLEVQKRFVRLKSWITRRIELEGGLISLNAPMNRDEDYTKGNFATYLEAMQNYSVLAHCRALLEDDRTSSEQRQNIEYTLEKLYGVHYSDQLEDYI